MSGFVKIYGSKLITSSLWDESPEARLVFLAMLAIADARGFVDVPNERALARVINLEPMYVERALSVLMAPDPGSRTEANEGRRVVREGTGWLCVNYEKYREFRSSAQEAHRVKMERWRAGKTVTSDRRDSKVTRVTVEAEAEAEAKAEKSSSELRAAAPSELDVCTLPLVGSGTWGVPKTLHEKLCAAFPGVDVTAEYKRADVWLVANPTKRKTARGMPKFLSGWMERVQNRGGLASVKPAPESFAARDAREKREREQARLDAARRERDSSERAARIIAEADAAFDRKRTGGT